MNSPAHVEQVLEGLPLSGGVAVARVCRFNQNRHSNLPIYKIAGEGVERELARVERATRLAAERLDGLRDETREKVGQAEAEIFVAQRMILEDEEVRKRIAQLIRNDRTNAENAVMVALDSYEARIREVDDEYIRDRASDIGEIKRRMLDLLSNMKPDFQCTTRNRHCQQGRDRIVVAEELTPVLTMELDTAHTLGFVTERGGRNSHAAILARALNIPAVSGIAGAHSAVTCGTEVVVDGDNGEIIISPSEETIARMKSRAPTQMRTPSAVEPVAGLRVMANISLARQADTAVEMKAEGVGLYRTEFEFLAAGRVLDEDEQYERYAAVIKAMDGRRTVFRMFDGGGDKPVPFLGFPREENPALGCRGGRLLLKRPDLLHTQARAVARAAQHGPAWVMYPMVVDLDQFIALRSLFAGAVADLAPADIRHGVMLEVPSACLCAAEILEEADFASIGTNDLIQYLLAVDRNNELVWADYDPDKAVLWDLVEKIALAGKSTGKPVSVCGEIAGSPAYVGRLMNLGFESVSVSPRLIPEVRTAALHVPAGRDKDTAVGQ
jgi:phosphotransferase system enzyme I (PtsI)